LGDDGEDFSLKGVSVEVGDRCSDHVGWRPQRVASSGLCGGYHGLA
jgi:hypothetical protein